MKKNIYKVLIESCWILLIFCFALKLLFGNLFAISVESQNFIAFCEWLDTHWLKYIIATIVYVPSTYIFYLCLTKQKIFKDLWIIILLIFSSLIKWRFEYIGVIIDLFVGIFYPLIKGKGKNWKWILIGNITIVLFQQVSLLTKNLGHHLESTSMLIGLVYSIDYYIMLVLYYLYIIQRKELK